ncbi:MAG: AsmA family protein, partial [Desulfobacterales bacterium]|nr:AsmA family protein [Desulfobacterales bacterium]
MGRSKLIAALLLGAVLLATGVAAALMFLDPAHFRGPLEVRATAAFGREVRIAGPIRLERSLTPRLVVGEIAIANSEGAADPHFATADEVAVQVALLPLLRGDLQVLEVHFAGVKIFLESGPGDPGITLSGDPGAAGSGEAALPSIERILIREAILSHRSAEGGVTRYEIREARLWNLPGEPERIEAEGAAKGVPIRIRLAADIPAEAAGPHLPWSARLEIRCPDLALEATGRVGRPFAWDRFDLGIAVKGDRPDTVEKLFDLDLGGIGAFEITGSLAAAGGVYHAAGLAARIQAADGKRHLEVANGTAAAGPDTPLQIALQGRFGDLPLSVALDSERPLAAFSEASAWPLKGRVRVPGAELELRGASFEAGSRVDLDAVLQGEDLGALVRLLGGGRFEAGRFRASTHALIQTGGWRLSDLEGEIEGLGPWRKVRLAKGRGAALEDGSISSSLAVELDRIPLSLSFKAGPGSLTPPAGSARRFELEASAAGAVLTAAGSMTGSPEGLRVEAAARLGGSRLERLGALMGASLPPVPAYELRGTLAHAAGLYELRDLSARLGGSRLSGSLRWEEKRPRPLLTGNLSLERLVPGELLPAPPPPASGTAARERPLRLDWLGELDARVRLDLAAVAGSPIPVEKISSDVTLEEGALSASIRGRVAGARLQGEAGLARRRGLPHLSLAATIGPVDAGRTLRQLNLPLELDGSVKSLRIEGRSSGRTPRALLEQAELSVRAEADGLKGAGTILRRRVELDLAAIEAAAGRGRGVTAKLAGSLNRVPFDATIETGSIAELYDPDSPLPVRLALRAGEVQLKAEGAVARPFDRREFDLAH